jgi:hypothetical protein
MERTFIYLAVAFAVFSFGCGLWCIRKPREVIHCQQRFYARINWRLEPLSWEKEERNTVRMGIFLLAVSATTVFFAFRR